ncbi:MULTISPECIES: neutral zinc metallopeptidase [unclassified Sphingomonas]|uniref:KPN_02809 family neutral zinc metallopeptidase n=1 Tax=unclassified Sphingomonas TaxID=196159 RepID=UPI000927B3BA|nr:MULTISPECIES: neutral zinc metallopeptidase [unclassified Sphingomonas]MBN8848478.1 zinc metallopeptidase [Sphingomonas sp.]MBS0284116.1 zinc metallopeptidase [Pseudomonadota bacterium]OJV32112.1 MAG: zinc metalloprotease [Sphingomonas sp. 67-36]
MRLDDFDPDINVEDQRGQSFGGGGFGGGGGGMLLGLLPLIGSRFGCGGIVVVLLLLAVFGGLGNLGSMLGGGTGNTPQVQTGQRPSSGAGGATAACSVDASSRSACNAFSSADKTWAAIFSRSGERFQQPKLVFYSGMGQSGCGAAQSAMGPFYCPTDQGIYLDTSFFRELQDRFHAAGDFAQDYVIAHEFGHHIQNLLGTSEQVQRQQARSSEVEGNHLSVRLELQADCYAGVWAAQNRDRLDPGDVQEGMTAAQAIGDDTLQKEAQGRVVPDSFTHGTSAQRQAWLKRGLDSGDPAQCDTFSGAI